MTKTTATEAVYTADGWEIRTITVDLGRVLDHAREHSLLPITTEEEALEAARGAYDYPGPGAGLWHGRRNLERVEGWRWLTTWWTLDRLLAALEPAP